MAVQIRLRTFSTTNTSLVRQIIELNVDYVDIPSLPEFVIYDNKTWRKSGDPNTSANYRFFEISPTPVDLEREGKILEV